MRKTILIVCFVFVNIFACYALPTLIVEPGLEGVEDKSFDKSLRRANFDEVSEANDEEREASKKEVDRLNAVEANTQDTDEYRRGSGSGGSSGGGSSGGGSGIRVGGGSRRSSSSNLVAFSVFKLTMIILAVTKLK
jgi:uncharacterized membrane protein YgcG